MSIDKEAFDSLWAYCTDNKRLVPAPQEWTNGLATKTSLMSLVHSFGLYRKRGGSILERFRWQVDRDD